MPESLATLRRRLDDGSMSAVELMDDALDRVAHLDPQVGAFISIDGENARRAAQKADIQRATGNAVPPLHGIPIAIKDNMDVAGRTTTMGAHRAFHHLATEDAVAVASLRRAGAIVLGKTNLHEFAWGATTENEVFGITRNPWDPTRNAHGSSGGSAVAVSAGMVPLAIGTDTGGSIRNPAAVTGITGLRPTHGLIDLSGTFPVAWTMDTVGPLARTAEDCDLALTIMARDPVPAPTPRPGGWRIGYDPRLCAAGVEADVRRRCEQALDDMSAQGITVVEMDLGDLNGHYEAWLITQTVESAVVHREWMQLHASKYSTDVWAQLRAGACARADDYLVAQQHRHVLRHRALAHLAGVDALAMPSAARTAAPVGRDSSDLARTRFALTRDPAVFTSLASSLGFPAVSLPCGFVDGLPIGLQLVGAPFTDRILLGIGMHYQQVTSWHNATPPLLTHLPGDEADSLQSYDNSPKNAI
ncbi:amidase [Sphaerimonospora sp. CA-214678]|uniref:amidase n=1 Tax=Sphaerimonospora sp. CA-214678 TaxID=3240029 RepID=UPI003D8AA7AB